MKRFGTFFKCLTLTFFLLLTNGVKAQPDSIRLREMAGIDISLLTCGPGDNVWSLYGHTAIRLQDHNTGNDIVANYGVFSMDKSFFIPLFVLGITDYFMGLCYFDAFITEYAAQGRWVKEQRLNLTSADKLAILNAIEKNFQPENRVYRYNYFYDNCTTRARDILIDHISGEVEYGDGESANTTYREAIHGLNEGHRWARLGNDLLLGVKADRPITQEEKQFLPNNLMDDFEQGIITAPDGSQRKLIDNSSWLLPPDLSSAESGSFFTPFLAALLLGFIILAVTGYEYISHKRLWLFDLLILLADGLAGLILFVMVFSLHPTVQVNFQILLFCPLNLIFLYPIVKNLRQGKGHLWLTCWIVCLVIFLILSLFQHYAEGTITLAICLLLRYLISQCRTRIVEK